MRHGFFRCVAASFLVLASAAPVPACTLCKSEAGVRVRAGIFDADFGRNLLMTLMPFLAFLTIVALIHSGPPWASRSTQGGHTPRRMGSETPTSPTKEHQS